MFLRVNWLLTGKLRQSCGLDDVLLLPTIWLLLSLSMDSIFPKSEGLNACVLSLDSLLLRLMVKLGEG